MRIGIDPGHGGRDPGAVGQTGLREKDVTLAVSLLVAEQLKAKGIEVFITRATDIHLGNTVEQDLYIRTMQLNNSKVDLAISMHINSATNKEANYISSFIQGKGGEAEKLAEKIQAKLVQATRWPDGGVRVKNLYITRETKMPAVIVECGFISNLEQERQLKDPAIQKKIAQAIAEGVLAYLGKEIDVVPDWKEQIMLDAAKAGLIDGNHGHLPEEAADKWFVLAVALNLLKAIKGGK